VAQSGKGRRGRATTARYRQIGAVVTRHGLGFAISALGVERYVPFYRGLFGGGSDREPFTRPERVRRALEELGAAFIKLGQVLSTRVDLLPAEYVAALARLQDAAPPVETETVKRIIAEDLGRPVEAVFARFDSIPLAAASIGQVHAAALADGTEVVVKVRRPGVVEQVAEDLDILHTLASAASRRSRLAADYDLVGLVEEYAHVLRGETDYLREARNAERFRLRFSGHPFIRIPRVFWETTTGRILTLERISGVKIDDVAELDARGIDRGIVAARDARMVMTMIFRDGFFHADPHPGNFFVGPDASIAVVDFGMVGEIDEHLQDQLAWAVLAFVSPDPDRQVDMLFEMGVAPRRVDRELLRRDLGHLRGRYYGRPLSEIPVRQALRDGLAVVRRHRLQLPPNFALLLKTLAMHESLVLRLDPSFDYPAAAGAYGRRLLVRQLSPAVWARWLRQGGMDWARLSLELPAQLRRLLRQVERGDLEVGMRPSAFDPIFRRLEQIANRLILAMLAAAAVVVFAILVAVYHLNGHPVADALVIAGLIAGIGFMGYLAITILRQ
jgi:ubiquinone biosynthesis protein